MYTQTPSVHETLSVKIGLEPLQIRIPIITVYLGEKVNFNKIHSTDEEEDRDEEGEEEEMRRREFEYLFNVHVIFSHFFENRGIQLILT